MQIDYTIPIEHRSGRKQDGETVRATTAGKVIELALDLNLELSGSTLPLLP
jgi:hypothetical protein